VLKRSQAAAPGEFHANLTAADVAAILRSLDANPPPNQMVASRDLDQAKLGQNRNQGTVLSIDSSGGNKPNWAAPLVGQPTVGGHHEAGMAQALVHNLPGKHTAGLVLCHIYDTFMK